MKLANCRYEEIKNTIADMLEDYQICIFPVDVDNLAGKMNIQFVYETNHLEDLDVKVIPVDGAVLTDYSKMVHKVFIANWSTFKGKQRYTKCHELGHIVLGHKCCTNETESESEFFSAYLLAPSCLIMVDRLRPILSNIELYPVLFGLSGAAAKYAYNRFKRRLDCGAPLENYEKRILALFKDSIEDIIVKYGNYEI